MNKNYAITKEIWDRKNRHTALQEDDNKIFIEEESKTVPENELLYKNKETQRLRMQQIERNEMQKT